MKAETSTRVILVMQARVGSSRLPGKVMLDLGGRTVLEWGVRACLAAGSIDDVIVATTTDARDDGLAALAAQSGAHVVRGSEDDVLSRYVQALTEHPADAVVRVTSDCPLMDPALIDAVVGAWRADPEFDYVSTFIPRWLPHGLDVELVTAEALRSVDRTAIGHDRIHVTSGVYADPDTYDILGLARATSAADLRVTVDTEQDLAALRAIVSELGTEIPSYREVIRLLRSRPDLRAINSGVQQKRLEDG